jgi:hypothetical protein
MHRALPPLSLLLLAVVSTGCAASTDGSDETTDEALKTPKTLTCTTHYADATYKDGFTLAISDTQAKLVPSDHSPTRAAAVDPTYKPTSKYAGYLRYRFSEAIDFKFDLIAPKGAKKGATVYLRSSMAEGSESYSCH